MKRTQSILAISLLLIASAAHAQLYKWVGPDGKVHYSDSPPPASVKKVETKPVGGSEPSGPALPFELAEAVRSNPVTLYTAPKCAPCDAARTFLTGRGVPFSERTVVTNADIAKIRELGDGQLPVALIGRRKQLGFDAGAWGNALTASGYPETSKLPPGYRNAAPQAAAPEAPPPTAQARAAAPEPERPEALPPAIGNAPPGFRF
jgi:glutaredoxin